MYTIMKIKEEDSLSVTQNDRKLFTLKTNSGVDNDCDVVIKLETPPADFSSLENGECCINHQIKSETITCSNSCEMETKREVDSEKNREHLPGESVISVKNYNLDREIYNWIEIKEEPEFLNRETSSDCNDIKVLEVAAVELPRLCTEAVDTVTCEDSSLVCVSSSLKNRRISYGRNGPDCESKESNVKTPAVEKQVKSELSTECRDEGDSCSSALLSTGKRPTKCNICEKSFTRMSSLKRHRLIHEDNRAHTCKMCKKRFTQLSYLTLHASTHEAQKAHRCEICERRFTYLKGLKAHYLIHEGKKPHKCQICEKEFTYMSSLKSHTLIHEGIKAYKCQICEKRFTRSSNLRKHNLIHKGEKPHKCPICEKRFTYLSTLKSHALIHDGQKAHKCEICAKSFTYLKGLKSHNLIHEGKKPHKCEICAKRFTRLSGLKVHTLVHEGERKKLRM